jgi:quinol monooxygenase YgiN
MAVKFGFLALLEAKPDKSDDLADLLLSARPLAAAEEGTVTWYAFKLDDTTYGVFDTFETTDAQNAHLEGEIPAALATVGPDLLAKDPDIRPVDIIAVK